MIHHFDPECITRAKESDHEEEHRVEVAAKVSKLAYEKRKQQEN